MDHQPRRRSTPQPWTAPNERDVTQLADLHWSWWRESSPTRTESLALGRPRLEFDDLDTLTGMDMVMKESQRLVAPALVLGRRVVRDTEILGYHIPAGTTVVVPLLTNTTCPSTGRTPALRPRAVRTRSARGQGAPLCLGAVRRRRPQVHRPALRRDAGQEHPAPVAAALPLERPGPLHLATRHHLPTSAERQAARATRPPRAHLISTVAAVVPCPTLVRALWSSQLPNDFGDSSGRHGSILRHQWKS